MTNIPPENSKEDILIVDDTLENLRLLSTVLVKQGYNVRKALNGRMALTAAQTVQPDLILLDISMPEMDGYEVCHRLKAEPKTASIPVIFLSALNEAFNKVRAFNAGGADYITKPFQYEEVLVRVQNQLALKAAEKEIRQLNIQLEERVRERTQELEEAYAKLRQMALYDPLTELPNRLHFTPCLEREIAQAQADSTYQFAVFLLDCDRFKVVNDSLGHIVGDQLLVAVAHRLRNCLDAEAILVRLEGDEFGILLPGIASQDSALKLADKILASFNRSFQLEHYEIFLNASVGIALNRSEHLTPDDLLRDADTAMHHAKASGKAQYQVFNKAMHDAAVQLLQLEIDLRKALVQDEFQVFYQPIVSIRTGRISGFEALVRWFHPERGMISPALFIPIAEETGLICQLGEWVLRQSCHQLRHWQDQRLTDIPLVISVNLSTRQLNQPHLVEQIDRILQDTQISPTSLKLEITESAIMEDTGLAAQKLEQIRDRGILLSIDDFGTGYSSLNYLHRLPVDTLKIDGSFINSIDTDGEKLELVRAIVGLAWNLGMDVVAEGVETARQLAQLRSLKCDSAQGYLFSKPVPSEQAAQLIVKNPQW